MVGTRVLQAQSDSSAGVTGESSDTREVKIRGGAEYSEKNSHHTPTGFSSPTARRSARPVAKGPTTRKEAERQSEIIAAASRKGDAAASSCLASHDLGNTHQPKLLRPEIAGRRLQLFSSAGRGDPRCT